MTEYLKDKFTVPLGGEKYRDGWERTFGKKMETCKLCDGYGGIETPLMDGELYLSECPNCEGHGQVVSNGL